jgi:uncharacterized membrane protein
MTNRDDASASALPFWKRWAGRLLVLSLMANLLFAGWIAGNFIQHRKGAERLAGASMVQVVPRKFFSDLPAERRRELLKMLRQGMRELRPLRDGSSQQVGALADILERADYSVSEAHAAIDAFASGPDSLAVRGSTIMKELIAKLTPEERKLLAAAIRERAAREKNRKK